jgi:hypothetical protein
MATPAEDPIRAEVERVLHAVLDVTVRMPVRIATAVPRCVLRRAARFGPLAEPVRVVQSIVDLVGAGTRGVVTPDDLPAPDEPVVAAVPEPPATPVDGVEPDLPIEDYESLAASHVVDRLSRLTPEELQVIQAFEVAHRGRRTVLGRVEQLLA